MFCIHIFNNYKFIFSKLFRTDIHPVAVLLSTMLVSSPLSSSRTSNACSRRPVRRLTVSKIIYNLTLIFTTHDFFNISIILVQFECLTYCDVWPVCLLYIENVCNHACFPFNAYNFDSFLIIYICFVFDFVLGVILSHQSINQQTSNLPINPPPT